MIGKNKDEEIISKLKLLEKKIDRRDIEINNKFGTLMKYASGDFRNALDISAGNAI